MAIIFSQTPYDTAKRYKRADGDTVAPEVAATPPPPPPPPAAPKSNTKKYLVWGAIAVAAYLLWKKFK